MSAQESHQAIRVLMACVGLVVLIIALLYWDIGRGRTDAFYVQSAELAEPDLPALVSGDFDSERLKRFHDGVHELKAGRGTVLAYSHYSYGDVLDVDDGRYRKLTVWLPTRLPTEKSRLQLTCTSSAAGGVITSEWLVRWWATAASPASRSTWMSRSMCSTGRVCRIHACMLARQLHWRIGDGYGAENL